MSKILSIIVLSFLVITQISCGNSSYVSEYSNENEAAIGLIKEAQPELRNDLMRVVEKSDRHDGGGWHMGYNMLIYNERTELYLPMILTVWPTSDDDPQYPRDLRTQPYKQPRYDSDVKPNSEWITRDEIVIRKNIFNGDTEYW